MRAYMQTLILEVQIYTEKHIFTKVELLARVGECKQYFEYKLFNIVEDLKGIICADNYIFLHLR